MELFLCQWVSCKIWVAKSPGVLAFDQIFPMDSDGHLASPPVRVPLPQEQDAAAALGTRKLLDT